MSEFSNQWQKKLKEPLTCNEHVTRLIKYVQSWVLAWLQTAATTDAFITLTASYLQDTIEMSDFMD